MSMDFIDKIKSLGDRIEKLKSQIQTEEATKNAFIMMIQFDKQFADYILKKTKSKLAFLKIKRR
jgi:hypothetical protein